MPGASRAVRPWGRGRTATAAPGTDGPWNAASPRPAAATQAHAGKDGRRIIGGRRTLAIGLVDSKRPTRGRAALEPAEALLEAPLDPGRMLEYDGGHCRADAEVIAREEVFSSAGLSEDEIDAVVAKSQQ